MRYFLIYFLFYSFACYSQCNKETYAQYYITSNMSYSQKIKVSSTIGKGSEISNSYNYVSFDQEAMYCIVYGKEIDYIIKLFIQTNNDNIYNTSCESISSIFKNGYVKGKDQEGRIWKIFRPVDLTITNQRPIRKYNPITPSINTDRISNTLSEMQKKINKNRSLVYEQFNKYQYRLDMIKYKIQLLKNPPDLVNLRNDIVQNLNQCLNNIDFGSNKSTTVTLSCTNRQQSKLDILDSKIESYKKRYPSIEKGYLFKTMFDSPIFEPTLYEKPNVNSKALLKCPKNAEVVVIDNTGDIFFKVKINGLTGYISKHFLKRQK